MWSRQIWTQCHLVASPKASVSGRDRVNRPLPKLPCANQKVLHSNASAMRLTLLWATGSLISTLQPSTKSFHFIIHVATDHTLTKLNNLKRSRKENSESIESTEGAYRNRTDVYGFSIRKFHCVMFFKIWQKRLHISNQREIWRKLLNIFKKRCRWSFLLWVKPKDQPYCRTLLYPAQGQYDRSFIHWGFLRRCH